MGKASGEFDVAMVPQPVAELNAGTGIGRMTLDKRYHGALTATGQGEFLSFHGAVPTSAVYVAIEKVEGTLDGRRGGFALQHAGIMGGEHAGLRIVVAPDSGTGELTGLRGTLDIRMEQGKHFYDFEYSLGE
ncbi:DUF3224 domain-containing protein [Massilia sp. YMA4]|uniref:DUF3224 domain-containing protein n=1 Tax=[Empedobacter] haloabium TaxID=592317 RepID=A0ABZ1UNG9_9BURK|nr:DUF3224 domain-containing protein [Massilia sp. YMA4]AXA92526.1 DUF3224 domain-containing protein [Massilia sp. YMA4]